jgi:hypothetical protein
MTYHNLSYLDLSRLLQATPHPYVGDAFPLDAPMVGHELIVVRLVKLLEASPQHDLVGLPPQVIARLAPLLDASPYQDHGPAIRVIVSTGEVFGKPWSYQPPQNEFTSQQAHPFHRLEAAKRFLKLHPEVAAVRFELILEYGEQRNADNAAPGTPRHPSPAQLREIHGSPGRDYARKGE